MSSATAARPASAPSCERRIGADQGEVGPGKAAGKADKPFTFRTQVIEGTTYYIVDTPGIDTVTTDLHYALQKANDYNEAHPPKQSGQGGQLADKQGAKPPPAEPPPNADPPKPGRSPVAPSPGQPAKGEPGSFVYSGSKDQIKCLALLTSGMTQDVREGQTDPKGGWASFAYSEKVPIPQLMYGKQGTVPVRFLTAFYLVGRGAVELVGPGEIEELRLNIESEGRRWHALLSLDHFKIEKKGF